MLTEAQKKKIEESRQRALAIREAKQQLSNKTPLETRAGSPCSVKSNSAGQNVDFRLIIDEKRRKALALRKEKQERRNVLEANRNATKLFREPIDTAAATVFAKPQPTKSAASGTQVNNNLFRLPTSLCGVGASKPTGSAVSPAYRQTPAQTSASTVANNNVGQPFSSPSSKFSTSFYTNNNRKLSSPTNRSTPTLQRDVSPIQTTLTGGIKGTTVLVSKNRFLVEIGYCPGLVEVFRSMSTKLYDADSKRWSFELNEYHSLMKKIAGLGNHLEIEPLPQMVLNGFRNHFQGKIDTSRIPDADLTRVDQTLVQTLMPFQREGVNFCISHGGRVLLADDMGLGKTLQSLCVACYYRHEWPLLIVVPSSVRYTWKQQMETWIPSLNPDDINVISTGKGSCTSGQVTIISYDLLGKMKSDILQRGFNVVIMDESHFLKSAKAVRTQAALPICKRAKRVILLSGTPALSRPSELYSQISAVDSKLFPRFFDFGKRYCAGRETQWGWDFSGSSNLTELQIILETKIMIRRMKKDVLSQLPSKSRQVVILDPSAIKTDRPLSAARTLVDKSKAQEQRGALLEYFHKTSTAKIPAVREYILDLLESDIKLLIFAHHKEMLDSLQEAISKKYEFIRIDGAVNSEQRKYFCDRFQTRDEVRAALLSVTAANVGLNLTAASYVVFAELFWNPGVLVQAEDRAHRIGQLDCVSVQYLVANGTADDYLWPLVKQKLDVLSKVGLSNKNEFSETDTKHVVDSKQMDILSFFDELHDVNEDADLWLSHSESVAPTNTRNKQADSQSTLLKYLQPQGMSRIDEISATVSKPEVANLDGIDWSDDMQDWLEDEDPGAPWPKKPRI